MSQRTDTVFSPQYRAQIEDKFRTYARPRLMAAQAEEVIRAVAGLEDLRSMRTLMDDLRGDARHALRPP